MSDLLPLALALHPEESKEVDRIRKELDSLHRRVGTSIFIEKILPKLLPGLHFSHDRRGYHNKQTTISDLLPQVTTVLKEKSLVDAKEELDGLSKRVATANSIEIVHEATNIEDDAVVYASGTFEDGYFSSGSVSDSDSDSVSGSVSDSDSGGVSDSDSEVYGRSHWVVPLDNNKRPTTCKLKDLWECSICVGGGFTNWDMKLDPSHHSFIMSENDGEIEYSLLFENATVKVKFDGWPKEEQESLLRDSYRAAYDIFPVTAVAAQKYPEATVRFTLVSFVASDIEGPLRRVKDIEKRLPEASSRSSLSQPKRPSLQTTMSELLPEKSLLDTKDELDGLYRRLETATSIEVMQENKGGDIVVCASGKFEDGHFEDINHGEWNVPLNNDKMPTCKLQDLWKCHLCVGGGFKYEELIAYDSIRSLYTFQDGRIESSILFSDSPLEVTMTIEGWPTTHDTSSLEWALAPGEYPADIEYDEAIDFLRKTVAENFPEATVRFDFVAFRAKSIKRPLQRLLPKHRKQQVREELKELALKKGYDEYLALAEKL